MKTTLYSIALLIGASFAMQVQAQNFYPGNYFYMVAEDDQSFFFKPSGFSPLQTGAFEEVAPSVSDHLLSEVNRNPANINQLTGKGYAYVDVKTLPEENVNTYFGCEVCLMSQLAYIYLPEPSAKKSQEPFLSMAFMMNPFENERFKMGFTYQYMNMDEAYYRRIGYPYGATYTAMDGLGTANSGRPFFAGQDYFNKQGHFPALFTGYRFSDQLDVALKLSYNHYRGDGSMLSDNFGQADLIALPQNTMADRNRTLEYQHWDISAGMNYAFSQNLDTEVMAGFLTGDFDQAGREISMQEYLNDQHQTYDDYFYSFDSNFSNRDGFSRDGQTLYGSVVLNWAQTNERSFRFMYRVSRAGQDLGYGGASSTISVFESQTLQNGDEIYRISDEKRRTFTNGSGEMTEWQNQSGIFLMQDFENGFHFKVGVQASLIRTEEAALELYENRFMQNEVERVNQDDLVERDYENNQVREMDILQNKYRFNGYLPVILKKSFSDQFSVEAGAMGMHQNFIHKYEQTIVNQNDYIETLEGETDVQERENSYTDNGRSSDSWSYINAYGSVEYSPVKQLKLRLVTLSDRRQISSVSSMDALRFRISAEINF